jgi:putative SOS response-associated peptidase YedK
VLVQFLELNLNMCYYNSISIPKGAKASFKGKTKDLPPIERLIQSGFEYGNWPIIKSQGEDDFSLALGHWELIAPWVKNTLDVMRGREKFNTLNATAERLFESKLFIQPALKRRCLVLSSGFYEWRHFKPKGAKKENAYPYFIGLKNQPYFYIAGIYQPWVDIESGEAMDTFSIVTTKANALMEQIHNKKKRMPTILNQEQAEAWLNPNLPESKIKELAASQIDPSLMTAYTIAKTFRTAINPQEAFNYEELA